MINQLILIGCSKSKLDHQRPAYCLYTGDLFKKQMQYADDILQPANQYNSKVMILSAKHGLLELDKVIKPYDLSLNDFNAFELSRWASKVEQQINDLFIDFKSVVFLAGKKYREPLSSLLLSSFSPFKIQEPLKGMGIGLQKQFILNAIYEKKELLRDSAKNTILPELNAFEKKWILTYGKGIRI